MSAAELLERSGNINKFKNWRISDACPKEIIEEWERRCKLSKDKQKWKAQCFRVAHVPMRAALHSCTFRICTRSVSVRMREWKYLYYSLDIALLPRRGR
jgi:hypothetical protein